MAQDPTSWLPIYYSIASSIVKGDVIITPNADTTVVAVSNEGIMVQDNGTKEKFHLSALQSFFEDELGLVNKERPQRQRRQRVLFNASILGGAPRPKLPPKPVDKGLDLIEKSFWATVSPQADEPSQYIVTDIGVPQSMQTYLHLLSGI